MEGGKANTKLYYIIEIIVLFCTSDDYFMDEHNPNCQKVLIFDLKKGVIATGGILHWTGIAPCIYTLRICEM